MVSLYTLPSIYSGGKFSDAIDLSMISLDSDIHLFLMHWHLQAKAKKDSEEELVVIIQSFSLYGFTTDCGLLFLLPISTSDRWASCILPMH